MPMDIERIRELLQVIADSGVDEVEIHDEDFKLVVRKASAPVVMQPAAPYPYPYPAAPPLPPIAGIPSAVQTPVAVAPSPGSTELEAESIRAPIVGTFYRSPSPEHGPYVNVGDRVKPGDVLCIIEAMKLMNEIECETSGVIKEILVKDSQPVEFDQPLFAIDSSTD